MRALVWRESLAVEDLPEPRPGSDEVLVRIEAAGVCHSDLSMINGTLNAPTPLVLGHEAAGVEVESGRHVVLNWAPACRECWYCTRGEPWLCARSGTATSPRGAYHVTLGLGALAEFVVAPRHAVIPVPPELPFPIAALLGCAVLTGSGAVRRTAAVEPGDSVLVIGLGGVGLSAVLAAKAAGAAPIIAVDVSEAKRELAMAAGASDFVVADDTLSKVVRGLTEGRGADHAFECVGRSATIRAAWRATRRGGQVIVVGMGSNEDIVELSALDIFSSARVLRSSVYGSSDPDRDLPELADMALRGELPVQTLITDTITLDEAPEAFARMARGEGARSVVVFD
jgi:S-(hydroxymethyl)glutathione dehydrogenase/alcohol dehydrogenase